MLVDRKHVPARRLLQWLHPAFMPDPPGMYLSPIEYRFRMNKQTWRCRVGFVNLWFLVFSIMGCDPKCEDRMDETCPLEEQYRWDCDECGTAWLCGKITSEGKMVWSAGWENYCHCITEDGFRDTAECPLEE